MKKHKIKLKGYQNREYYGDIIIDAINRQSYDFEDCVQYLSSVSKKADCIITRDKKGFSDLGVVYMTADEFLEKCYRNE